ncbi:MAG: DEAD/DEAH box helicase [Isosphaeraceae bacterium]|nr:DEAD/DEAH box helicase [Isosphaeraceae bacterium]
MRSGRPTARAGLGLSRPEVVAWFQETHGEPTPPQSAAWPLIAAGKSTLILSPTGSGKTLAAFLAVLDHCWEYPKTSKGVRILYVSPLKALNNDIYRNLQSPLVGILETAERMASPLPPLTVGLRTGDTPADERRRQARRPPDILITTPESLHLLLTSRARESLASVSHVIVDEIHAVCSSKRGVFLTLLLERLEELTSRPGGLIRIGLSATQKPLDEVAAFLSGRNASIEAGGGVRFEQRPIEIVDVGRRKELDLEVSTPLPDDRPIEAGRTWPAIEQRLLGWIREHRATIVFANNRRVVERLAAHLNELDHSPIDHEAADLPPLARAHHGSLHLDERRAVETALKDGELRAVVATASLEMGIHMGAVDLVCQVESPGSIARALQRVGRAGHVVGRISKGRLIAKTPDDLLEAAALCQGMQQNDVESLRVPTNCLDVLAQQVVAMVAMDVRPVDALFTLVRQCHAYRNLSAAAFESVLSMISGRFPTGPLQDLRARVVWDRIHGTLHPLPGTHRLALSGGGTIPDTGQYPLHLGEDGPKIGELDEEFVLERRVGDTFVLGSATWRIESIDTLRVIVSRAEGHAALMPFWRGEDSPRSPELGERVGRLVREIAVRRSDPMLPAQLREECRLDEHAARVLIGYISRQIRLAGAAPDDRTILVETFRDPTGEVGLAVLTPFGGRLHRALQLALQGRLRERLGLTTACLSSGEGLLIRVPRTVDPPLDLFDGLTPERAEALIRTELGDSALFGLRFRQNAARALLMPRPDPTKRTPLWLQRLRAKDLLQVVRKFPDHPIVIETYRECLDDDLDLPRLRALLSAVADGGVRIVQREGEIPSPFASMLIFRFTSHYLYKWDEPIRGDRPLDAQPIDGELLDSLLDPGAIGRVEARLRGIGRPPRTLDEAAETLRTIGDLTEAELTGPIAGFVAELAALGRASRIEIDGVRERTRWISAEDKEIYERAIDGGDREAISRILERYVRSHALVGLSDIRARYPFDPLLAAELLNAWAGQGGVVRLEGGDSVEESRWSSRSNLEEVRRLTIAIRRRESVAVRPEVFADFVVRRQQAHPSLMREGLEALDGILERLAGFPAPLETWEGEILPSRLRDFRPSTLDAVSMDGRRIWIARGTGRSDSRIAFFPRESPIVHGGDDSIDLSAGAREILEQLESRGAGFAADIARRSGRAPSAVRAALDELVRASRVTNDRLDPLRPSHRAMQDALESAARGTAGRRRGIGPRRSLQSRPEGRWEAVSGSMDPEESSLWWIETLLERYGVITREILDAEPWAPSWKLLTPLLARAEMRGEVRRGYFVEGLSGVQYASEDAMNELARASSDTLVDAPAILLSTLDPANLYGTSAPFDVGLLEGGTARLPRTASNSLVLIGGRPVLIIEGAGKRLTGLASASEAELRSAIALLPRLARSDRRVIKVESYNEASAVASPAALWLMEAGFVRMPPGFAYYAGWS